MQRNSAQPRNHQLLVVNHGFTFIELLIVIVVMALLFSVGYAGYREFQARQGIINVTRKIKADLRLAQEYALSQRKLCAANDFLLGYEFVASSTSYEIRAYCDRSLPGPDYTVSVKIENLPTGFSLIRIPVNTVPRFNVLGRGVYISLPPNTPSMTIRVRETSSGAYKDIIIKSSGEIYEP
ncbi:hypothetical protein A2715_01665 [Candidatus Woesebacteria bacterium RIFCSPHIGHO2_01_FULL_39_32]|uniref:Pilin assembly protein n=2 Tax=Candidatus Woeseibacteriota TaxID=1752722 RepID=A0A0G0SYP3_9BACT|nr:MAG: Pilin assembly protein [Candidatus Woesebacteria bacterium GW2011_GWA1_39_8]OGM03840.1 MAG: hypothetical protein A2124_02525 [Candidatus Woesebacteria bacterium GWB1_37_5]OGM23866.1 MAG: hypothetical protein A2715_01665 [Candidatus Woesebacteria bacterium RIFCSPHIGHO2_01_FULL_39_32]OGM64055.1 MAG: hypothetical protein A2893_02905 [Candidatus Woesebacteria bacterium RIFCSPLOWO2_01_FULL_39_25]